MNTTPVRGAAIDGEAPEGCGPSMRQVVRIMFFGSSHSDDRIGG